MEGRVQFEGGFGEGVKSWVGVAGPQDLRPPPQNPKPETQTISPNDASLLFLGEIVWRRRRRLVHLKMAFIKERRVSKFQ